MLAAVKEIDELSPSALFERINRRVAFFTVSAQFLLTPLASKPRSL